MNWSRVVSVVVLALVAGTVSGVVSSVGTTNRLFLETQWAAPALASAGIVAALLLVFVALGRPWQFRTGTAYW